MPTVVMVFEPHPATVTTNKEYRPIFTRSEWNHLYNWINVPSANNSLNNINVDYILVQEFDRDFAKMSPTEFAEMLFSKAGIIVVGEGYRFGHEREGTIELLQKVAEKRNCKVIVERKIKNSLGDSDEFVSTSLIRKSLEENNMQLVWHLLGFPYFIMGIVTKGKQIGRELGFPTLNLYPPDKKLLPPNGVYLTNTSIADAPHLDSITNVGVHPTLGNSEEHSVETFILNFPKDRYPVNLYGTSIKVDFIDFIRPEIKFNSLAELKQQIQEDIKTVENRII
jgi:riboflavin kinase/FMN adenylyltransferase